MDEEDLQPRTKKPPPKNLDTMSIQALEDYIQELEAEIARVRGTIAQKQKAQTAADSFFKKKK